MATMQAPAGKPVPPIPARHEALVDGQLHRAVGRIRLFDVLAAVLGLAAGTLLFGLTLMLLDAWLDLPMIARLCAFGGFLLAASIYLVVSLVIPLTRPINPHYAAVRLENTLPGAKNSLVNYLDLREKALPAVIKGAVGAKAARDVSQARVEDAIRSRPVLWLGLLTAGLSVAVLVMLAVMGPAMFFALLGRNFYAFGGAQVTRTQIALLEPASGDATVPVGLPVNFVVRLSGKVPAASAPDHARLLFKYSQNEQLWQERPLIPGDVSEQWTYRLPGNEVHNGFYYRIIAGDAATPEHFVQARSGPIVTGFDVLYTHRPYLRKPQETSKDANLIGWRGTEVTLVAHTNRTVQTGRLIYDGTGRDPIASEPVPDLPNAMRFRLVLDKDGAYRVRFASAEGEHSGDSVAYKIKVTPDHPPVVEITEPADEFVSVAANGTLPIKGKVKDDFGITDVQLRLRMEKGPALEPRPYRPGKFRYDDGGFPTDHDYFDALDMTALRFEGGKTPPLKEGDVIEYWLQATDNCDFPRGQVGQSQVKKIKVLKPVEPKEQRNQRDKTEQAKKQHDKNTAEQRSQENKERQEQAKNQGGQSGEQSSGAKDSRTPEQKKQDEAAQKAAEDFQKEVEKNQEKGESKPDPDKKGESRDQGANPESKNGDQGSNDSKGGNDGKGNEGKSGNEGKGANPNDAKSGNDGKGGSDSQSGKGNNGEAKPQQKDGQGGQDKGAGAGGESKPEPRSGGQDAGTQHGAKSNPNNTDPSKSADSAKGGSHGSAQEKPQGGKQAGEQHAQNKPDPKSGEGKGPGDRDKPGTSGEKKPGGAPKGDEKVGTGHPDSKEGKAAKDDGKAATARGDAGGTPGEGKEAGKAGDQAKGEARAKAKPGQEGPTQAGQGSSHPPSNPSQAKDAASARGDGKEDRTASKGGNPAPNQGAKGTGNPQLDEVNKLAREAAKGNPEEQVNAERRLQQIAKEAKDAKVRQAAEKALKDPESMAGGTEDKTGETPMQTAGGNSGKNGKEDPTKGPMGAGQPDQKGEPKDAAPVSGQGTPTKQPGDTRAQGEGANSQGNEPGTKNPGSTPAAGNPGNQPGGASQGGDRTGDTPPGGTGQEPGSAAPADPLHKKRAAELQLEQLMNRITPDMLKERNWSKEDLLRWQAAMKDRIQRDYQRDLEQARAAGGRSTIPGGFRRGTTGTGTAQDLQNIGKTAAPPEIRRGYQEFTQELSKLKK